MSELRNAGLVALSSVGVAVAVAGFVALRVETPAPPPSPPAPPVVDERAIGKEMTERAKRTAKRQRVDGRTKLLLDDGWELVAQQCTSCHSAKLIIQNAGDRDHWEKMIRWMQATQNLWPLEPEVEDTVLDYLARNYGPREYARRAPLDPWLLPPDPNPSRRPPRTPQRLRPPTGR